MEKKSISKIWLVVGSLLVVLGAAYGLQVLSVIGEKGQGPMGKAFETIGYHAMRRQYDGIPQMRVVRAFAESVQCSFWNFEWIWGRCVVIGLDVRDYRPEYQPIVDAQVLRLAEQLRRPCVLLPTLGLPNEQELARDLGCGSGRKPFKLRMLVSSVTLVSELVDQTNPHMWYAMNREELYSNRFEGEF